MRSLKIKFWGLCQGVDITQEDCELTFLAGSGVFEKEDNGTG